MCQIYAGIKMVDITGYSWMIKSDIGLVYINVEKLVKYLVSTCQSARHRSGLYETKT